MPNISKPAALGLLSTAALLLGACSYTAPSHGASQGAPMYKSSYTSQYSAPHAQTYSQHRTSYAAPAAHRTYAPRAQYAAAPTTISHHAPYGAAAPSYGHAPRGLRGAFNPYMYGSLGATMYDLEDEAFGLQGRLGYQVTPVIGAELEASTGILDDTEAGVETGYDFQIAGFGTASANVAPKISLHGRVGYHATRTDMIPGGKNTETGFAYGAGTKLALNPRDSIRLDYTVYEQAGADLDSLSVGYQRKF